MFSRKVFLCCCLQNDLEKGRTQNNLEEMKDSISQPGRVADARNWIWTLGGQLSFSTRTKNLIAATWIIWNEMGIWPVISSLVSICPVFCTPTVLQMCEDWCNIFERSIINCGGEFSVLCKCVMNLKRTRTAGPSRNASANPFDTTIIVDGLFS